MIIRSLLLLGFALALLTAFGCSSGDNGATPALACADGGSAANGVTLVCGSAIDSATERVDVVIGVPASGTTTLRGLNFDVTYDPSKLEFEPAGNYASALFPSSLVAVTLSNGLPGRVVVSVQEFGGLPDVAVGTGQHIVLSLSFQRGAGMTFGPTPLAFENAEATGSPTAIDFASGLAMSFQ